MIRFVRIALAIVAAGAAAGFVLRQLGLQGIAGTLGEAVAIAIALPLVSLVDREWFYGTPPKHHR